MSLGDLGYFANRALRHLFSIYHWVVMVKPLEPSVVPSEFASANGEAIMLREAVDADLQALTDTYPEEFSGHLTPELISKQLRGRQHQEVPCFVALNRHCEVCGATWCPPNRDAVIRHAGISDDKLFEMMNTFVVVEYRGQGIGGALRHFALNEMAKKGYKAVISYVWYSRQESLAMNFATGSRLLAEKRQITILGWRKVTYRHRINLSRLPLPQKPGVLVIGEPESSRGEVAGLFRRWGIAAVAVPGTEFNEESEFSRCAKRLTEQAGCKPLLFCCESMSRERFHGSRSHSSVISGILPCQWEDVVDTCNISPAELSGGFGDDLRTLDHQGIGLHASLYLNAIGSHDLLMLWKKA